MASERETAIAELSNQLTATFEQLRAADRQVQLCKNQKAKADLVIKEVEKSAGKHNMYRSLGRMFVLVTPQELTDDLKNDVKNITDESERSALLLKNLEQKKEQLTKALNDLTPKKE